MKYLAISLTQSILKNPKTGVLIVNLGTPDSPSRSSVYVYLKEFLLDPRVIDTSWLARNALVRLLIAPFRSGKSAELYEQLWTEEGSPIKVYGKKVELKLQQQLGSEYVVKLAMRYQNPSIQSALNSLLQEDIKKLILIPLFPQYASATSGSVIEKFVKLIQSSQVIPSVSWVSYFFDSEEFIECISSKVDRGKLNAYDHILFSYHGLPVRQLIKADDCGHCQKTDNCCSKWNEKNRYCYAAQCHETSRLLAKKLDIRKSNYTTCFQSRLGREEWLKPYTSDVLEEMVAEKNKNLLVFSPAFVADCLETTIEIGVEYEEEFKKMGGEALDLVPSLNDDKKWIDFLANLVIQIK